MAAGKSSITITLPKISNYLKFNTLLFLSTGLGRNNNVKLIIKCDDQDLIESSSSSSTLEISNFYSGTKFSLTHDRIKSWRNIVSTSIDLFGNGITELSIPYGTDLVDFFNTSPSGTYRLDNASNYNNTLGLPYDSYYYDISVISHERIGYKSLIILGSDGALLSGSIAGGVWSGLVSTGVPIGTPIPYSGSNPPPGYILMNGSSFDKTKFKSLAKLFTDGIIPDMRGQFIRGWDNGKGIDPSRTLLSTQLDSYKNHSHGYQGSSDGGNTWKSATPYIDFNSSDSGAGLANALLVKIPSVKLGGTGAGWNGTVAMGIRNESVGGSETRPTNISYNYIIRAA